MTGPVNSITSLAQPQAPVTSQPAASAAPVPEGEDFISAMGDVVSSANADLKRAESLSIQGIKGEAETHEVVTALMSAEQSLRLAVAVRDKIVQAYLDLSRMQI
jgi:flagellar hook-basal body complex protein FliE